MSIPPFLCMADTHAFSREQYREAMTLSNLPQHMDISEVLKAEHTGYAEPLYDLPTAGARQEMLRHDMMHINMKMLPT